MLSLQVCESLSVVGMKMCESGRSGEVFYFKGFYLWLLWLLSELLQGVTRYFCFMFNDWHAFLSNLHATFNLKRDSFFLTSIQQYCHLSRGLWKRDLLDCISKALILARLTLSQLDFNKTSSEKRWEKMKEHNVCLCVCERACVCTYIWLFINKYVYSYIHTYSTWNTYSTSCFFVLMLYFCDF